MNNQGAYTITDTFSLIILNLAAIGAITVIVIAFKIIEKIIELFILKSLKKGTHKNNQSIYINKIHDEYQRSTYYLSTHLSYSTVIHDKGRYGEYLIFKKLEVYENYGSRFLFNCYLPKENNKTTEIDIILLTLSGIFVFESKNYSGWIFGSERQETWTQTLPAGNKIHKEHFYNPIKQNKSHVKALKDFIGDISPIYSIIVFSDNCKLKDISVSDSMTEIVCFGHLYSTVENLFNRQPNSLTQDLLISIYNKLYPYTQVPEEVKQKHVENIQNKNKK